MLAGHIDYPGTHESFLNHQVWDKVIEWLKTAAPTKQDGEYEIQGRDMYAVISTVDTLPREQAVFEAHKQYIDVHYCISENEIIEWAPMQTLNNPFEENHEKDYALFNTPENASEITMIPGIFVIFFPEDAHMPKIKATSSSVKKVVIKIHTSLIS